MEIKVIQKGIDLIKRFEGIMDGDPKTVNLDPYLCPAGYWTIGWGHVVLHNGTMLKGIKNKELAYSKYPKGITKEQAQELLIEDLNKFIPSLKKLIKKELNDNQDNALLSFAFNLGPGNLASSTLLKKVNSDPNDPTIRLEFNKWVKAGGKVLPGLVKRRLAEAELYYS